MSDIRSSIALLLILLLLYSITMDAIVIHDSTFGDERGKKERSPLRGYSFIVSYSCFFHHVDLTPPDCQSSFALSLILMSMMFMLKTYKSWRRDTSDPY